MTSEQFAYWLQGFAELNDGPPSAEQWQAIRDHLSLVFNKVTPAIKGPLTGIPFDADRIEPGKIAPFEYRQPAILAPVPFGPATVTC